MNIKNLIRTLFCVSILTLFFSCSKDEELQLKEDRSFVTNEEVDFFINIDKTVDIIVTGKFTDWGIDGNVTRRGFVYGKVSNPEVNDNNSVIALGPNPVNATFKNLEANQSIFIRGFFEMSDGTFFYGNEIKTSTNVNASDTRSLVMTIKPELHFKNHEGITPELQVTAIEKESPIEIGFEYSFNDDFSNSSIVLDTDVSGNIFVTTYAEFITGLKSNTVYYFRPYAKYADNTVTNGGNSTASFTTKGALSFDDFRSFVTNAETDFFINRDRTVNIKITGEFTDFGINGEVTRRGFVYGTASNPEVSDNNTETALGPNPVNATFRNLEADQSIYIRGFFEMSDGTFFYGNEIQTSTNVDGSATRSIAMTIKPDLHFKNYEGITPVLQVTIIEKESPTEIGFEYSLNEDFSDSSIALKTDVSGNVFRTTYSEFITGLKSNTVYYFRPYAKYADNVVTNGGNSKASFTTN